MTILHDDIQKGTDILNSKGFLALHKKLLTGIDDSIAGRFRSGKEWVRIGTHIGANPDFVVEYGEETDDSLVQAQREMDD